MENSEIQLWKSGSGGEALIDSRLIAKRLGITHRRLKDMISRHRSRITRNYGLLHFSAQEIINKTKGRPEKILLLNEDQALFVVMLSKNSERVISLKEDILKAFSKERKTINCSVAERAFLDRLKIGTQSVPEGYWSVLFQAATIYQFLERIKFPLTWKQAFPDISVGIHWSKYWKNNELEAHFGPRCQFMHQYPRYYPQSKSGPQPAWCYPLKALSSFKEWMRAHYKPKLLTKYLKDKCKKLSLASSYRDEVCSNVEMLNLTG